MPKVNINIPFAILIGSTILTTLINIVAPPKPFLSETGIIYWNISPISAGILYFGALIMWIPTGFVFFRNGMKARGAEKIRYILMSIAFFIISIFGPLIVIAQNDLAVMVSQIMMTIGFINLFGGIFIHSKEGVWRSK